MTFDKWKDEFRRLCKEWLLLDGFDVDEALEWSECCYDNGDSAEDAVREYAEFMGLDICAGPYKEAWL